MRTLNSYFTFLPIPGIFKKKYIYMFILIYYDDAY